jgi:hypothetical protein
MYARKNKKHLQTKKARFIYPNGKSVYIKLISKRKLFKLLTELTDKVA